MSLQKGKPVGAPNAIPLPMLIPGNRYAPQPTPVYCHPSLPSYFTEKHDGSDEFMNRQPTGAPYSGGGAPPAPMRTLPSYNTHPHALGPNQVGGGSHDLGKPCPPMGSGQPPNQGPPPGAGVHTGPPPHGPTAPTAQMIFTQSAQGPTQVAIQQRGGMPQPQPNNPGGPPQGGGPAQQQAMAGPAPNAGAWFRPQRPQMTMQPTRPMNHMNMSGSSAAAAQQQTGGAPPQQGSVPGSQQNYFMSALSPYMHPQISQTSPLLYQPPSPSLYMRPPYPPAAFPYAIQPQPYGGGSAVYYNPTQPRPPTMQVPGMQQPQGPPQQSQMPKRERNIIRITDPNTNQDVTAEILNPGGGSNPSPPNSSSSDVAAEFARMVAERAADIAQPPPPAVPRPNTPQETTPCPNNVVQVPVAAASDPELAEVTDLASVTPETNIVEEGGGESEPAPEVCERVDHIPISSSDSLNASNNNNTDSALVAIITPAASSPVLSSVGDFSVPDDGLTNPVEVVEDTTPGDDAPLPSVCQSVPNDQKASEAASIPPLTPRENGDSVNYNQENELRNLNSAPLKSADSYDEQDARQEQQPECREETPDVVIAPETAAPPTNSGALERPLSDGSAIIVETVVMPVEDTIEESAPLTDASGSQNRDLNLPPLVSPSDVNEGNISVIMNTKILPLLNYGDKTATDSADSNALVQHLNDLNTTKSNSEISKVEEAPEKTAPLKPQLKVTYKDGQWSPHNLAGKKQYDRSFLMQFQDYCQTKPEGLPNLDIIVDAGKGGGMKQQKFDGPQRSMSGGVRHLPQHDAFTPNYLRPAQPNRTAPMRQRPSNSGRKVPAPQPTRSINLSLTPDVKLHETENAWRRGGKEKMQKEEVSNANDEGKTEEVCRKVRAILNKLTPQKFESLLDEVNKLEINSEDRLNKVIDLVFEKAIDEPSFSVAYANMCKRVAMMQVPESSSTGGQKDSVYFRKLLLTKCQTEFEKDSKDEVEKEDALRRIEAAETEEKKRELQEELDERIRKAKRRSLGNIRFIGELYKLQMLTANIMHNCLQKLLSAVDEDSLECLCRLLTTIGAQLEAQGVQQMGGKSGVKQSDNRQQSPMMEQYFKSIQDIIQRKKMSSRVRFMLQDVVDLRQNHWKSRREDANPKMISEIHEEAEKERMATERRLQEDVPRRHINPDKDNRGKRSSQEDGWTNVSKKGVEPGRSLLKPMQNSDSEQGLRPGGFSRWVLGSSGGAKNTQEQGRSQSQTGNNRYSALAEPESKTNNLRPSSSLSGSRDQSKNRGGQISLPASTQRSGMGSSQNLSPGGRRGDREQMVTSGRSISKQAVDTSPHRGERAAPSPPRRDEQPLPAPVDDATYDETKLENAVKTTIDEFVSMHNCDEVIKFIQTIPKKFLPKFVTFAVNHILEKPLNYSQWGGKLVHTLVQRNALSTQDCKEGMLEIMEIAEDLSVDIPKFWEYIGELLSPLLQDSSVGALRLLKEFRDMLPDTNDELPGIFLAKTIHVLCKSLTQSQVVKLWRESELKLGDFLSPGADEKDFMNSKKLWLLTGEIQEKEDSCTYDKIDVELRFLIREKDASNDEVIQWLLSHIEKKHLNEPHIVRALVTEIAHSAIGGNDILVTEKFKHRLEIISKTILCDEKKHDEKLELQILYALEAIDLKLQHPKGLLHTMFDTLFEVEIVSEDVFYLWNDSPTEEAGHSIATLAVQKFFDWLKKEDDAA